MPDNILGFVFPQIAKIFGGIEPAGLILLIAIAAIAYISKATLPTVFFIVFLLAGSLYGSFGGSFILVYGLCIMAGATLFFLALKQQFSQV